jgi:DNA polymerase III epsilon subunit-like protein
MYIWKVMCAGCAAHSEIIGGLILKESIRLRSGATVPQVSYREAQAKNYLDRATLKLMHLTPDGAPAAYSEGKNGGVVFWFDPEKLTESDPELWYAPEARQETVKLESGTEIERMSMRRAASFGYYPKERLTAMHLEVIEEPVAFTRRRDKEIVYFYDKMTTLRMPLMCVKCGKDIRFKKKLCRACYEEDLAVRRAEGDAHRSAYYGMDRSRVLFFDLELTGFYDHDEIISISIFNALGEKIMDTLVRPVHTKKWKRTEKIHGITPDMVKDAQTLEELTPEIKEIFAGADNLIAYGVSTDYSHIKYIYETEKERKELHSKIRCCANEFVRYIHEHRPDIEHASLTDAMACFGIEWDGVAHTSIADTIGCMKVWERLFPHYYEKKEETNE